MQTQTRLSIVNHNFAATAQVSASGPNGGWSPATTVRADALAQGPNGGWISSAAGPNGGW